MTTEKEESKDLMDTRSVCAYLSVSTVALRRFVCIGHLPALRLQSNLFYRRSDVEKVLTDLRYLKGGRKPL
jgi:predicted site-specific integrase-resolvase